MADIKISEMLQELTPESTDLIPLVRTSATSGKNRKLTLASLFGNMPAQIVTTQGIISGGWQTVSASGAMIISKENVHVDVGPSPITVIVPNGTIDGQTITFLIRSASSNATITPLTPIGFNSVVLAAVGNTLTLKWDGIQIKWMIIATYGGIVN